MQAVIAFLEVITAPFLLIAWVWVGFELVRLAWQFGKWVLA